MHTFVHHTAQVLEESVHSNDAMNQERKWLLGSQVGSDQDDLHVYGSGFQPDVLLSFQRGTSCPHMGKDSISRVESQQNLDSSLIFPMWEPEKDEYSDNLVTFCTAIRAERGATSRKGLKHDIFNRYRNDPKDADSINSSVFSSGQSSPERSSTPSNFSEDPTSTTVPARTIPKAPTMVDHKREEVRRAFRRIRFSEIFNPAENSFCLDEDFLSKHQSVEEIPYKVCKAQRLE